MELDAVQSDNVPVAVGPYSQAITAGNMVFCSGQVGIDPDSGTFVGDDMQSQTRQVLSNLRAVLEAAGTNLAHVVKVTVYLANMGDYKVMNEVYSSFFGKIPPARVAIAVKELPLGARVEMDAIAIK